ncbi:hypothetical protein CEXT_45131 [Caerostris extrusa]|uniref:Uncharacterized protein n=1 Tax=Caerostris extrusa TaxID=172846 RepID=A0AAV4URG4_CAEEX|nr:hypothetical protein CEXT_45131 [Caerostris extrusa]
MKRKARPHLRTFPEVCGSPQKEVRVSGHPDHVSDEGNAGGRFLDWRMAAPDLPGDGDNKIQGAVCWEWLTLNRAQR